MTGSVASPLALTATDRCDRCGAAASVRAVLTSGGELLFCGHHAREYSNKLEAMSAVLQTAEPITSPTGATVGSAS